MNTIVTGGAGFIGSHVAEILLERGHRVLVVDDLSGGFEHNIPHGAEFAQRSTNENLDHLFESFHPDVVYHLAAYAAEGLSHHIPVFNYQNNLLGTANVLSAGYRAGISHFVFTSSIAAYGHSPADRPFSETDICEPCDPYGVAKLACENHIRVFCDYFGKPSYTIFRPHNVFGPRQNVSDPYRNVIGIFMKKVMAGESLPIFGDGSQTRSFSYVTPVAQAIAEAPFTPAARNQVFNVGGDTPMSVKELAVHICRIFDKPQAFTLLEARKEVTHAHADHSKGKAVFPMALGTCPDVIEGLIEMAEYVRAAPVPETTACPSPIEIGDQLPPSWRQLAIQL